MNKDKGMPYSKRRIIELERAARQGNVKGGGSNTAALKYLR